MRVVIAAVALSSAAGLAVWKQALARKGGVQSSQTPSISRPAGSGAVASLLPSPRTARNIGLTASSALDAGAGPVPPTFFGLHLNRLSTPWPSIPFGSLRLFSDLTTWRHLEGEARNRYHWDTLDSWLRQAQAHRVDLMYTFANTPRWASSTPNGRCGPRDETVDCTPPSDVLATAACQGPLLGLTTTNCQFKEFIASLLNHVCSGTAPDKNCQIRYYECWNEANADGFWIGTSAEMAKMCSDVVTAVKAQCRACMVLTPGVAAGAFRDRKDNGEESSYDKWTENFLRAYKTHGNYPDIGAFHGYAANPFGVNPIPFPETFGGSGCRGGGGKMDCPQTLPDKIATMRAIFDRNGMAGRPLWNTEGGWTRNMNLTDPDAQAAFLARWFIVQASAGVARAFWFMYDNGGSPNGWGGLWDPEHGVNQAGTAYGQVYRWLVGASFTKPCSAQGTVWTCELARPDGYRARIVWEISQSYTTRATFPYKVEAPFVEYRDLDGNRSRITGGSVQIGSKPILLENQSRP